MTIFPTGTATFTNGSKSVTSVSLTSGTLAFFDKGTQVKVESDPVLDIVEATKAINADSFSLAENWPHATGTYNFYATMTAEGIRSLADALKTATLELDTFKNSISVSPTADSVVQRDSNGRIKAAPATEADDALVQSQAQTSSTDDTANALLRVGAFGLRAPVIYQDFTNPIGYSGFVRNTTANPVGTPDGGYIAGVQLLSISGDEPLIAIRTRAANGTPSNAEQYFRKNLSDTWKKVFQNENILGTVSQSGGVPTGAIIERGSNANGEYVKYADGTLICVCRPSVDLSTNAFQTFYFPSSFIDESYSIATGFELGSAVQYDRAKAITIHSRYKDAYAALFNLHGTTISTVSEFLEARVIATGRWY